MKSLRIMGVFVFISFTWIFFRAESFSDAWTIIARVITLQNGITQPFSWTFVAIIILAVSELAAVIRAKRRGLQYTEGFCPLMNLNTTAGLTVYFVFVGIILALAFTGENPFVYFQF